MELYASIVAVTIASMIVTLLLIHFNETLNKKEKRIWRLIALIVIIGTAAEYVGTIYDSYQLSTPSHILIHKIVKFIEFSFSPYLTLLFLKLDCKNIKILTTLHVVAAINVFLEFLSAFVGNIYRVNADGTFNRGEMFFVFVLAYSLGFVCLIVDLVIQSRTKQTRNYYCIIAIFTFLLMGIGIQLVRFELKVDWLAISIAANFLLFQYCDMSLKKDGLTGLLNRKMFDNMCRELRYDSAIIIMDVNDFRDINNEYGHHEGDRCLITISKYVLKVYAQYGFCYRYGGDEIVIVLKRNAKKQLLSKYEKEDIYQCLDKLDEKLNRYLDKEREKITFLPRVSTGFCEYRVDIDSIVDVFNQADTKMYKRKSDMKKM